MATASLDPTTFVDPRLLDVPGTTPQPPDSVLTATEVNESPVDMATLDNVDQSHATPTRVVNVDIDEEVPMSHITELVLGGRGFLACDQFGIPYLVSVDTGGNPVVYRLGSSDFEGRVVHLLREAGHRPKPREIKEYIETLKGQAQHSGRRVVVSRRVALAKNGDVLIALHDQLNTHVRIAPGSVSVLSQGSTELFYRSPFALPMAMPAPTGDLNLLKRYVNLNDEQFVLYLGWLTYTLAHAKVEGVAYPLLVLVGGQGTGKSHISKVTIRLVDPSAKGVQRLPANPHDMALSSQDGHLLAYDNLRKLTTQQSDSLCIMATGGSVAVRKLYTDDEIKVTQLHSAVVLNSIVGVVEQPDLAQRSLTIHLEPMQELERRTDNELLHDFEADLPVIQRGLFDLVARILAGLPKARVQKPQRMINFVRWLAAMEIARDLPQGMCPYQEAFELVINDGQRESLQDNIVGAVLMEFADTLNADASEWVGTPADLLGALSDLLIARTLRPPRDWPDNAIALSKRLIPLQAALMTQGISVTFKRGKTRTISIRKLGEQS
jgi:hypothetical protein